MKSGNSWQITWKNLHLQIKSEHLEILSKTHFYLFASRLSSLNSFSFRFLGELFKLKTVSIRIAYNCMRRLLKDPSNEESLECLCEFLTTAGKEIDQRDQVQLPGIVSVQFPFYYLYFTTSYTFILFTEQSDDGLVYPTVGIHCNSSQDFISRPLLMWECNWATQKEMGHIFRQSGPNRTEEVRE